MTFAGARVAAQSVPAASDLSPAELEQYERFAQTMLQGPGEVWTIRGFTKKQQDRLGLLPPRHPWSARLNTSRASGSGLMTVLPLDAEVILNTAFPFGDNDGSVWAGKGITTVFRGGFAVRWNQVALRIAPTIFRAENADFTLMNNNLPGKLQFADGQFPEVVDRPQRFGASAYQVLDPGQSSLTIEGAGVVGGLATANQSWGPSERYQFILGNNAAGFAHVFVGSQQPFNVGVARIHSRFMWGMLEQSAFSPVGGPQYFESGMHSGRRRFASGLVSTLLPNGIPGMEFGFARFFHSPWPEGGLSPGDFTALFQNVFKKNLPKEAPLAGTDNTQGVRDNQLFSLFTRWAPPGTGFEVYGEFGRDDHSFDLRDLLQEPDHGGASRLLGVRKMWNTGYTLRAEAINYEAPQLTKFRPEGSVYLHYVLRQGHTQRGQPLGANTGMGSGSGSFIAVDRYSAYGRTTFEWSRAVGHRAGSYYLGGPELRNVPDVLHTLSGEAVRFRGPIDVSGKVRLTLNFNRNFQSDVFNMNLFIGTRYRF